MKILYHHRIASKDGQYVHVEEIVKQLKAQGHEIIMVCPKIAQSAAFGSSGGFVHDLKNKLPGSIYELLELLYNLLIFLKLTKAIITEKPDVIYERYNLFTVAGIWAAKLFKRPLLLEVNAPLFQERSRFNGISLKHIAKATENYCWKEADHVLPVTQVLADIVKRTGVPENRVTVIPNGVDTSRFNPGTPPAKLPLNAEDRLVIGFVGFCREWHELERVVELIAPAELSNLFLLIVGDGPARPMIEDTAKALGAADRVHLTGLISREQMPSFQAAIDIALQPAVVDYASPLKILEYMASGKAIIAPDQENIKELLTNEKNALLFRKGDSQSFHDAITRLAADTKLRSQLGNAAAVDIESRSLSWDQNARRIIKLFEANMGAHKSRSLA
ncbi:glycosyltransferase family 4 protein [Motiliproteus sp. SC1-56]|uniref:glycosyltransferase family 4 protein n=1 Tax=Motiliproteus sp. SC1-56 TaxID=2799565 RepID=UPI001A8BFDB5|nr:glycosyltransferase family 4 protein [Motiliproteus sp. SC1-56]